MEKKNNDVASSNYVDGVKNSPCTTFLLYSSSKASIKNKLHFMIHL